MSPVSSPRGNAFTRFFSPWLPSIEPDKPDNTYDHIPQTNLFKTHEALEDPVVKWFFSANNLGKVQERINQASSNAPGDKSKVTLNDADKETINNFLKVNPRFQELIGSLMEAARGPSLPGPEKNKLETLITSFLSKNGELDTNKFLEKLEKALQEAANDEETTDLKSLITISQHKNLFLLISGTLILILVGLAVGLEAPLLAIPAVIMTVLFGVGTIAGAPLWSMQTHDFDLKDQYKKPCEALQIERPLTKEQHTALENSWNACRILLGFADIDIDKYDVPQWFLPEDDVQKLENILSIQNLLVVMTLLGQELAQQPASKQQQLATPLPQPASKQQQLATPPPVAPNQQVPVRDRLGKQPTLQIEELEEKKEE